MRAKGRQRPGKGLGAGWRARRARSGMLTGNLVPRALHLEYCDVATLRRSLTSRSKVGLAGRRSQIGLDSALNRSQNFGS